MAQLVLAGFWGGLFLLLVAAPGAALVYRTCWLTWQATATTAVVTCAQLRDTWLSGVAVEARTSAQEIITAPTGEACICYWSETHSRDYESGTADQPRHTHTYSDGAGHILIRDETGTARIDPELAKRRLTGWRSRLVITKSHRWTHQHTYDSGYDLFEERVWFVRPDVPVYAIGATTHSGSDDEPPLLYLAPAAGGGTSTRPHADVVAHLAARTSRWAATARTTIALGLAATSIATTLTLLGTG
jgi:hypothetical protein